MSCLKSLLYGFLAVVSTNTTAYADNFDSRKYDGPRGCQFEAPRAAGKDMQSFLLRPSVDIDGVGIHVLVDADGTPGISVLGAGHKGVTTTLRNLTSVQAEHFWAQRKAQNVVNTGVRTFDFCSMNTKFQIDFLFNKGRLEKFRVKRATLYRSRGTVDLGVKSAWYEAK